MYSDLLISTRIFSVYPDLLISSLTFLFYLIVIQEKLLNSLKFHIYFVNDIYISVIHLEGLS